MGPRADVAHYLSRDFATPNPKPRGTPVEEPVTMTLPRRAGATREMGIILNNVQALQGAKVELS